VNMYDRCILSVGLIQFCEAATIFGVSRMLGYCADEDLDLLQSYLDEMPVSCGFRKSDGFGWAFHLRGERVRSKAEQREIFLGGATGYKGQWTDEQIEKAKRVAAVMSGLWREKVFRDAQERFTQERHMLFAMKKSRDILFPKDGYPTGGAAGALRAAFLSFAGNLPAVADEHFRKAYDSKEFQSASLEDQLVIALQEMTFGPGIAIYPHRYEAIRPVLEREWGLDLPDFASELRAFEEQIPELAMFPTPAHIQQALIEQGYDLGPAGADGDIGPKSRAAIKQFETEQELEYPDGIPDAAFMQRLAEVSTKHQEAPAPSEEPVPEPDDEPLERPEDRVPEEPSPEPEEGSDGAVEAKDAEGAEESKKTSGTTIAVMLAVLAAILATVGKALGLY
jgi:hypothetical protein